MVPFNVLPRSPNTSSLSTTTFHMLLSYSSSLSAAKIRRQSSPLSMIILFNQANLVNPIGNTEAWSFVLILDITIFNQANLVTPIGKTGARSFVFHCESDPSQQVAAGENFNCTEDGLTLAPLLQITDLSSRRFGTFQQDSTDIARAATCYGSFIWGLP